MSNEQEVTEQRVEHFYFDGYTYRRYPDAENYSDRRYFKRTGPVYLHRAIWEFHYGPIPDGYEIHHVDSNTGNNVLSNLRMMTVEEHRQYHSDNFVTTEALLEHLDRIRPLTKEWHASEEGRLWHIEHGKDSWKNCVPVKCVCEFCGKDYETFKPEITRVCSNNCKSALRRKEGVDNEDRICKTCNETFSTNKYSKILCCGRECSKAYYRQKKLEAQAKAAEEQSSNNI